MKEFDYSLDYKTLDFTNPHIRKLYRIGRGEQGVLLVRPYTEDICQYWRFLKYTKCSWIIHGRVTSLVWTWHENSLRWDLLAPEGMQITVVEKNTLKLVKYYPRTKMHLHAKKLNQQQSSNTSET